MSKIGSHKTIIFIGKRNTGKSVLALDYLYHNQDFPIGTCISPTDKFNKTFKNKIPQQFIYDKYSAEILQKFITRQEKIVEKTEEDPEYKDVDPRAFLIFDDCLADAKSWIKDDNVKTIFMNGRHLKITFLLTMQYVLGIPPDLRENVDYIFICKANKISTKKKLYEHWAGMFNTFDDFNNALDVCTDDYGCMVIDNSATSDKLEDQVFWYKADYNKVQNFRICDQRFWDMNNKLIYIEHNNEGDYEIAKARKNKGITVQRGY